MLLVVAGVVSLFIGWVLNKIVDYLPVKLREVWRKESQVFLEFDIKPVCSRSVVKRYFILELLTVFLSLFVAWFFGLTLKMLVVLVFTWGLLALAFIDLEQFLLPDIITLPFLWLGLLISLSHLFVDVDSAIMGAIVGYSSLWVVAKVFIYLTGREGIGHGDLKMLAMLGAWVGWQALPWVLLIASLLGSIVGIRILIYRKQLGLSLPFGPCLALAGWVVLLNNHGIH